MYLLLTYILSICDDYYQIHDLSVNKNLFLVAMDILGINIAERERRL